MSSTVTIFSAPRCRKTFRRRCEPWHKGRPRRRCWQLRFHFGDQLVAARIGSAAGLGLSPNKNLYFRSMTHARPRTGICHRDPLRENNILPLSETSADFVELAHQVLHTDEFGHVKNLANENRAAMCDSKDIRKKNWSPPALSAPSLSNVRWHEERRIGACEMPFAERPCKATERKRHRRGIGPASGQSLGLCTNHGDIASHFYAVLPHSRAAAGYIHIYIYIYLSPSLRHRAFKHHVRVSETILFFHCSAAFCCFSVVLCSNACSDLIRYVLFIEICSNQF